jgi:hypothetical protein
MKFIKNHSLYIIKSKIIIRKNNKMNTGPSFKRSLFTTPKNNYKL